MENKHMTLRQLHELLGQIIAAHDAKGWSERNDQEIVINLQRRTPMGLKTRHFALSFVGGGSYGLSGKWYTPAYVDEADEITP